MGEGGRKGEGQVNVAIRLLHPEKLKWIMMLRDFFISFINYPQITDNV